MAKQGQHKNNPVHHSKPGGHERSEGHNKPSKSVPIVTGSYKKHETYEAQARRHEDPGKQPQSQKNDWHEDLQERPTAHTRARAGSLNARRSGSESNTSAGTRGH